MSSGEENGNRIYIYKNDPKVVKKGVNITDVRYPQGGYLPLLTDTPYNERKFDNTSYKYDDRFHHGSRPMHRSTFTLSHVQSSNDINRPISSSYDTQNNYTYRGYQLKPEYIQHRSGDQFKQHFNISCESPMRSLQSSYSADFYKKNNEKEYVSNFDIMPKYSLGKQIYQLEKEGKPRVYPNRGDTIKEALIHNQNEPEFWTQYNRTHGLLAAIRGNGEPIREYPNRTAYNIFTGERLEKPSWTMNGNYRLVSKYRRDLSGNILD